MKSKKNKTGFVEKLCQFLGRNNFASEFLDYVSSWLFPPPTAMAYHGSVRMPVPNFPKDHADKFLGKQKPIMMARPPSGTENFRGNAPTSPHAGHTQPSPVTSPSLLSFVPIIGPLLHRSLKEASQHASKACADPLYRGMHGAPCKFEGGTDNKCPKGSVSGWWWAYEVPGKGRIYYVDCCGGNPTHAVFCNWTSEPNWCVGYGKASPLNIQDYNCTLAILESDMKVKAVTVGSGSSSYTNYEVEGVDP